MDHIQPALELVNGDDFLEYYVFPRFVTDNEMEELEVILSKIIAFVQKYTEAYIWHHDSFNLIPKTTTISNNITGIPSHLYGITNFDGNIEDEWYIVFLLLQLTKEFKDLIVRVIDSDGEFLLIESSNYLPEWADPEICAKRAYLYEGYLHFLSPDTSDNNDHSESIAITDAIYKIRANPSSTLLCDDIQQCIINRVKDYPNKIKENYHKATLFVPVGIAAILQAKPQLVSSAVRAFCNRDMIDMKVCRAMKYFPPEIRVLTSVTFTRYLYAMLVHSKYQPDTKTGWNLPAVSAKTYKSHSLGTKLACGFEILISQAKREPGDVRDVKWNAYRQKLEQHGYFKDLLEHSKEYNNLLNKAKEYYLKHVSVSLDNTCMGHDILQLVQSLDCSEELFKRDEENLPPDDCDSWLNITPHELDKMLEDQYGHTSKLKLNNDTDPAQFKDNIDEFINHMSGFAGAEFPEKYNMPPADPANEGKIGKAVSFLDKEGDASAKIDFDPSLFTNAIENIMNFGIPEDESWDLDTDSDMSDYDIDEKSAQGESQKLQQLMEAMDRELANTTIGESFLQNDDAAALDDVDTFKAADMDVNALKNILESYKAQLGNAGPASNMLGPMGIQLDNNVTADNN